jgi:hypothetical protein
MIYNPKSKIYLPKKVRYIYNKVIIVYQFKFFNTIKLVKISWCNYDSTRTMHSSLSNLLYKLT